MASDPVNILLVDDQPAKLLGYEVVLADLGENLIKATSAREALEQLLKTEIAVILMDVAMPEMDGFELAAMVREHPRFQQTAIIFVSAIHLSVVDFLRGYQVGAIDYVSVPVIPELLKAKVRIFADLFRKNRQLERLNAELEARVADRTAELEASSKRLQESEHRRDLALGAGRLGSWDWDVIAGDIRLDEGQYRLLQLEVGTPVDLDRLQALIPADERGRLGSLLEGVSAANPAVQAEFRVDLPGGDTRWLFVAAAATYGSDGRLERVSGVTSDITERKRSEERQSLLAREIDHRAKNALALVQSVIRLSRGNTVPEYITAVEGRIQSLARAHALLAASRWEGAEISVLVAEELAPYQGGAARILIEGPPLSLWPQAAQAFALVLHELVTNATKYGALSVGTGQINLSWQLTDQDLVCVWAESGGPPLTAPKTRGLGLKVIAASIRDQLGGDVSFEWRREGLRCTISVGLKSLKADSGQASQRASPNSRPGADAPEQTTVMLVEDDAIIGMMMHDLLSEMGIVVTGPLDSVGKALPLAREAALTAAVLDINVRDGLVYPVATALRERGVPFVFVSGFGSRNIDPSFLEIPILEKPVDSAALSAALKGFLGPAAAAEPGPVKAGPLFELRDTVSAMGDRR